MPAYSQQKKKPAEPASPEEKVSMVISSISGENSFIQQGRKRIPIAPGSILSESTIVVLEPDVTMIAVEPTAGVRYTFKGAYAGSVRNYVKQNEQNCVKSISLKYVDYLLKLAAQGRNPNAGTPEDNVATVFRKTGLEKDSTVTPATTEDSLYHATDSLSPSLSMP